MTQDKDDILCLRAENTPKPEKVEVGRNICGDEINYANSQLWGSQIVRWLVGEKGLAEN